ncbi:hypothetical protein OEZ85_004734 [Tetradesmus obliquus]|uniref:FBD domain-containing protein n=1 Tax=Tetradesmus obliquus TaxID=3088 RepID=A0ABY8ULN8_TETOB|nr:hypothetical protein OEZ85_004734 [Tetradesmus obliquus]
MRQLTRLNLEGVYGAACLAQLPAAQLLHLELFVGGGGDDTGYGSNPFDGQQLPLGHLTAVTLLDCRCNSIHLETVLPPQLRVLPAEAFGQLPALQALDISDWRFEEGLPAEQMLQQLAQATQLTRLVIKFPEFEEGTPQQLADVIKQLTGLQELVLQNVEFRQQQQQPVDDGQEPAAEAAAAAAAAAADMNDHQLVAAISGLPQLRRVILEQCSVSEAELSGTGYAAAAATVDERWSEFAFWQDE